MSCFVDGRSSSTADLDGIISEELAHQESMVLQAIQAALVAEIERNPALAGARTSLLGRPSTEAVTLAIYYTVIEHPRWYHRLVPLTRSYALRKQQYALGNKLRDVVHETLEELEQTVW